MSEATFKARLTENFATIIEKAREYSIELTEIRRLEAEAIGLRTLLAEHGEALLLHRVSWYRELTAMAVGYEERAAELAKRLGIG